MVLPSAEMPPFCVEGTSAASSPAGAPAASVNSRPRRASLVPLMTLPPSLVISVFMIETCCHSPIVIVLPPGLAAAAGAASAVVGAAAAGDAAGEAATPGEATAAGDAPAAGAAPVAGAPVGAVVGFGAGAVVAAGWAVGAGEHAASKPKPRIPTLAPRRCRTSRLRRRRAVAEVCAVGLSMLVLLPLVPADFVDLIAERLVRQVAAQVVTEQVDEQRVFRVRGAHAVRGDQHIGHVPQRALG